MRRLPLSAALVAALFGTAVAQEPGQPPRPTPVPRPVGDAAEEFRRALVADPFIPRTDEPERKATRDALLAHRKQTLDKLAVNLRSARELSRALVLREWRYLDPDADVADIDLKVFNSLADRLLVELKRHTRSRNPAVREAVANLAGEMSSLVPVPPSGTSGVLVRRFLVSKVLPVVVAEAKDSSPQVQAAVARALGRIQSNSRDVRQLRDPSTRSIFSTLKNLQDSPSRLPRKGVADALTLMLQYYSPQERDPKPVALPTDRIVLERIISEILDNLVPLAFRGLNDPSLAVRRENVDTLQRIVSTLILDQEIRLTAQTGSAPQSDRPPTAEELRSMRGERAAVVQELARLQPRLATFDPLARELRQALNDNNADYRARVVRLLEDVALLRDRIRQRLQAAPEVEEEKKPKGEKAALRFIAQPAQAVAPGAGLNRVLTDAEATLLRGLNDRSSMVRLAAANAIENLGPEARHFAPELVRHLRDRNLFVRWVAARALGKMSGSPPAGAVEGLARLMFDSDLSVRAAAAVALEAYGPDAAAAVPALVRMANVGDGEVRQLTIRALGAIGLGGRPAVLAIARELSHEDTRVRRAAARALGNFGADVAPAAAALERALKDEDAEVRRSASEALLNIPAP